MYLLHVGAESCSAILFFCGLMFGIYWVLFVRSCGTRTAGEVLFCNSPKEYPEKAATSATPLEKQGYPLRQCHYHAAPELAEDAQTTVAESP